MNDIKNIAVLGSTGSIGRQTLEVLRLHPDRFRASVLAAKSSVNLLLEQAEEFSPACVAVTDEAAGREFRARYTGGAEVLIGKDALTEAVRRTEVDLAVIAVVGMAGLAPTLEAIRQGKEIALANKETLVAGGALVTRAADEKNLVIRPVDSEHSAIFQCLLGQDKKHIRSLLLTASGGPFRGRTRAELETVTLADCLKHPTWNMGRKVTIDSATMFNKGLEIIEAHWLFRVPYDDIHVIVQPQSLIHSMVEYEDGSILAQIGNPDMRLPIQFALTYPERLPTPSHEFVDWSKISEIITARPDEKVFRSLSMAYAAGKAGGDTTTAFNAANEEAVAAFIREKISFLSIYDVVEDVLGAWHTEEIKSEADVWAADEKARRMAKEAIGRRAC